MNGRIQGLNAPNVHHTELTERQQRDLDAAVVDYLSKRNVSAGALEELRSQLGIEQIHKDDKFVPLAKKWTAVVRLQRQVLDLKQQLKAASDFQLNDNLVSAGNSNVSASTEWLPIVPPKHELLGHRQPVGCIAFHPSWLTLCSGSEDGQIKVWDAEMGDLEKTIRAHTRAVTGLAFSSLQQENKAVLASCSSDMTIKLWDPANNYHLIRTFHGHEHTVSSIQYAQLGASQLLVSASRDKTVRVWDCQSGYCVRVFQGHSDWVRAVDCSSDGLFAVSAGNDRVIRLWPLDETTFTLLRGGVYLSKSVLGSKIVDPLTFSGHEHVVECVAIAPQSAHKYLDKLGPNPEKTDNDEATASVCYLASGSRDKTVRIWSVSRREIACLRDHENWVRALVWHPSGRYLISCADDRTIRVWDLANGGRQVRKIDAHDHFVACMALAPNQTSKSRQVLATGSVDASIKIWQCL